MSTGFPLASALVVALGLTLSGWLVGLGFERGRAADRFVTVKGVAEREVQADIAVWPIRFTASAATLSQAQAERERQNRSILEFLAANGIAAEQTELQGLEVVDALANPYRSGPVGDRFIISQTVMVRSTDPGKVFEISQKMSDLLSRGVVLSSQGGPMGGPTFLFTKLNELKPAMIAEATASAREAAQQFAKDSGSDLGSIRQANQGVFVILPRDPAPGVMEEFQLHKTVRVVSTIEYRLRD